MASWRLTVAVEPPLVLGVTVARPLTLVPFVEWSEARHVAAAATGALAETVPGGGGVTDGPVVALGGVALLVAQAAMATLAVRASSLRMV